MLYAEHVFVQSRLALAAFTNHSRPKVKYRFLLKLFLTWNRSPEPGELRHFVCVWCAVAEYRRTSERSGPYSDRFSPETRPRGGNKYQFSVRSAVGDSRTNCRAADDALLLKPMRRLSSRAAGRRRPTDGRRYMNKWSQSLSCSPCSLRTTLLHAIVFFCWENYICWCC